ncbi:MAG: ABC transporter ATP-binding protein [Acidibacillus sp.]|uniref:ABC transporter ATP-binding protein n=1 Tax=Sulfoacidibacillus ferrooxidans TaxID=2005001 RepID=A0A9X1V6P4_9BACL|nr:ABC transporter ATP-binding protein [Sulfoacidibacillus ferrooxidans]MCI0182162.1 putative ABC transporter ATP-binding protein [Sulfoacidibacillus ferrooxidans]MCY0894389.1 ABC transporter ATP-binding protein [Acidibacillus sp.]
MLKLLRYLKPYRTAVTLVLVLIFLQSLSSLYLPYLMSNIVDVGVVKGDIPYIIKIGGFMLLVTIIGGICAIFAGLFASKASAGFGQILRSKVFTHVENFTLHEFDQIGTSSLIVRTNNDIMQVQQLVNMMLRMMVMAPLTAIGGIIMAVYTDAKLSLIIVVVMPVLGLAIYAVLGRGISLFRVMQEKVDILNRVLRENLTGIRVIRSFGRTPYELHRFDAANLDLTDTSVRVYKIMAALMPMMMLIINLSTLAILWFGGIRINDGAMQVGNLMAFIQYVMQIMFSVMMVSMMAFMIPRGQASAVRIHEVLQMVPEISDPISEKMTGETRGDIEFRDVTFSYPGAQEPALAHLSFHIHAGETTAIIGGTGSGKSTLIHLIPRFYDIDSGSILVDGVDVREMSQAHLRAKIGFVPQKAVLFSETIAQNIRYGNENSTDEEVRKAAEVAQAYEFIATMKNGFDSVIAQGGANVSGGQKQRLAIARALVRKAEVYIFDDSFSALDFKTDANLRAALKKEVAGATVILVAQRVSTVMDADRIIVLDDGKLAGIGTHKELMNSCSVYREIVESQLSEEEIA